MKMKTTVSSKDVETAGLVKRSATRKDTFTNVPRSKMIRSSTKVVKPAGTTLFAGGSPHALDNVDESDSMQTDSEESDDGNASPRKTKPKNSRRKKAVVSHEKVAKKDDSESDGGGAQTLLKPKLNKKNQDLSDTDSEICATSS